MPPNFAILVISPEKASGASEHLPNTEDQPLAGTHLYVGSEWLDPFSSPVL